MDPISHNMALGLCSIPKELSAIIFKDYCAIEDVARCREWRLRYERDYGGLHEVQRGFEESTAWTWRDLYKRVTSFAVNLKYWARTRDLDSVPNDISDEYLEKFSVSDLIAQLTEEKNKATTEEQQKEVDKVLMNKSYYAVFYGHRSLVKALLAHNLLRRDPAKIDLLKLAIEQGWDQICCMVFKAGLYEPKLMDSFIDVTYLHLASKYDDTCQIAELLIQSGANPNMDSEVAQPPLYLAVKNNQIKMIKLLLRCGAKAGGNHRLLDRPIHFVRSIEVLNMLLEAGAADSPCVVGRRVISLLWWLSESPRTLDMFKVLLDSNRGYEPERVLDAAYKNSREQIIALLEAKPEIVQLYKEKYAPK